MTDPNRPSPVFKSQLITRLCMLAYPPPQSSYLLGGGGGGGDFLGYDLCLVLGIHFLDSSALEYFYHFYTTYNFLLYIFIIIYYTIRIMNFWLLSTNLHIYLWYTLECFVFDFHQKYIHQWKALPCDAPMWS